MAGDKVTTRGQKDVSAAVGDGQNAMRVGLDGNQYGYQVGGVS